MRPATPESVATRVWAGVGYLVLLCAILLPTCGGSSPTEPQNPSSTTQPSPAATPTPAATPRPDLKPVIEALFMGSGPLAPSDGNFACPARGYWNGFPRSTAVRVRVSSTVSADRMRAIRTTVDQVAMATNGSITAFLEMVDDPNPRPGMNEVTSTAHPDPVSQGCPFSVGCIMHVFLRAGVFSGGRAVQPPTQTPNAFAHDVVGHGTVGMCHIDGNLIGGAGRSLMSGGPGVFSGDIAAELTPLDIEASQAVYASELSPGATRADFVRVGLINP